MVLKGDPHLLIHQIDHIYQDPHEKKNFFFTMEMLLTPYLYHQLLKN